MGSRVPRERSSLFLTELFERYQRSEKALVSTLTALYMRGVSTRNLKAVKKTLRTRVFDVGDQRDKPLERLNQERKRRMDIIRFFPILEAASGWYVL